MELNNEMANLERELSLKKEQLQKVEDVSANLKMVNEELEARVSSLNMQVLDAQQEAKATYKEANKAQGIRVQVGFRVLRKLLLKLEPSFDI